MWVQEDAPYCGRCWSYCAPGSRATTYRTISGLPDEKAPPATQSVLTHEKGSTCGQNAIVMCSDQGPVRCPCCCYLPYLNTKDGSGKLIGTSKYICDMCLFVPKFKVWIRDVLKGASERGPLGETISLALVALYIPCKTADRQGANFA